MNPINNLISNVAALKGARFASFTYKTKKTGEVSRYTVNLGGIYHNLVEKSRAELQIIMENLAGQEYLTTDLSQLSAINDQYLAAVEVRNSLDKTLAAHARGEQNPDYTKKGMYAPVVNGLNINTNDNSLQMFGTVINKVVLEKGVHKKVKSAPMTILKGKIKKRLSMSKFREFALDMGNIREAKLNGETIEFVDSSN